MATICVSGIPRGLNHEASSLLIRKHIGTVAQVEKVWVHENKGFGFVTLFDATSVDVVLTLDSKIHVNGCVLRLNRKYQRYARKPDRKSPINFITTHNDSRSSRTAIGYDTYSAYKEDVPQTDVLYQYAKPVQPRHLQQKRKPWKNVARLSSIPTPKSGLSGRVYKRHGRHKKKKASNQYRSQKTSFGTNGKTRKYKKVNGTVVCDDIQMEAVATNQTNVTFLPGSDDLDIKMESNTNISQPVHPRVHVYDHATCIYDIDVDNTNVFQSINAGVSNKSQIPLQYLLLSYNGKTIDETWPLTIENDANIHLTVKGKGGMMEGSDSNESNDNTDDSNRRKSYAGKSADYYRDFKKLDYSGHFKINLTSGGTGSTKKTTVLKMITEEEQFVKFCHLFLCDLQRQAVNQALESDLKLGVIKGEYPPSVCSHQGASDPVDKGSVERILTILCCQLNAVNISSTSWNIDQVKSTLSSLDSYQQGIVIGYEVSGDVVSYWVTGECGAMATLIPILERNLGTRSVLAQHILYIGPDGVTTDASTECPLISQHEMSGHTDSHLQHTGVGQNHEQGTEQTTEMTRFDQQTIRPKMTNQKQQSKTEHSLRVKPRSSRSNETPTGHSVSGDGNGDHAVPSIGGRDVGDKDQHNTILTSNDGKTESQKEAANAETTMSVRSEEVTDRNIPFSSEDSGNIASLTERQKGLSVEHSTGQSGMLPQDQQIPTERPTDIQGVHNELTTEVPKEHSTGQSTMVSQKEQTPTERSTDMQANVPGDTNTDEQGIPIPTIPDTDSRKTEPIRELKGVHDALSTELSMEHSTGQSGMLPQDQQSPTERPTDIQEVPKEHGTEQSAMVSQKEQIPTEISTDMQANVPGDTNTGEQGSSSPTIPDTDSRKTEPIRELKGVHDALSTELSMEHSTGQSGMSPQDQQSPTERPTDIQGVHNELTTEVPKEHSTGQSTMVSQKEQIPTEISTDMQDESRRDGFMIPEGAVQLSPPSVKSGSLLRSLKKKVTGFVTGFFKSISEEAKQPHDQIMKNAQVPSNSPVVNTSGLSEAEHAGHSRIPASTYVQEKKTLLKHQAQQHLPSACTVETIDQSKMIKELGLEKYFPNRLTFHDVMKITNEEKHEAATLADIPSILLRKLIMLDDTGRENVLYNFYCKSEEEKSCFALKSGNCYPGVGDDDISSSEGEDDSPPTIPVSDVNKYNPVDIFLSIFVCLHPSLQNKVCSKMFMCQLAIPLVYPVPLNKRTLVFSKWPLRTIIVKDRELETSIVNCEQHVVSFVRLGRPKISKSRIANEILHDTFRYPFFNFDCNLGRSEKCTSNGLIEVAWFLPFSKESDAFSRVTQILNLRGELLSHDKQMQFLKKVSNVMIIVTDKQTLHNRKEDLVHQFRNASFHVIFLVFDNGVTDKYINRKRSYYTSNILPKGFNAFCIRLTEDGSPISMSEIKNSIVRILRTELASIETSTINQICKTARSLAISIDEDNHVLRAGIKQADILFAMIKDEPLHQIKDKFTPLQRGLWQTYTKTIKEYRKASHLSLKEKSDLGDKMAQLRKKQWETYKTLLKSQSAMKTFIEIIDRLNDEELPHFLDTLKFRLDEKSRKEMPVYRKKYEQAWKCFKTQLSQTKQAKQAQLQKEVAISEQNLSEASFGIEHVFRELGQICEASNCTGNRERDRKLAKAVARSIMLGYPFEVMDGDVANVPVSWINQVVFELRSSLKDKKILTLSILGLQSSGKSTLLNAMFGLSFSVSAGRCTRGIYMHVLPVQNGMFSFDYVLVVDTEGLRAPELSDQKYQHDNELATMVIGMADIAIININGENTSEMKDILQICVHAFLRLQNANKTLKLRQSCIFIHQHVSAVDAKTLMFHSRKRFDEALDRLTLEAAQEENIGNIKHFRDVIDFDSDEHVWYFPDLWNGEPPMATVNSGYSSSIQDVKRVIFKYLAKRKAAYLNISDTFVHYGDLWDGILANDFVFSFRNSIEIRNYNTLEDKFTAFVWDLECVKNNLIHGFQLDIKQYGSSEELFNDTKGIGNQCKTRFNNKACELKKRLIKYFEESDNKSEIAQWKNMKLISWNIIVTDLETKLQTEMRNLQDHCRIDLDMKDSFDKNKREIVEKASFLAEQMKGHKPTEEEMKTDFNSMWTVWISKWDIEEEKCEDIQEILLRILHARFRSHIELIEPELRAHPLDIGNKQLSCLVECLDNIDFKPYYEIKSYFIQRLLRWETTHQQCSQIVIRLINGIFREVETKLRDLSKTDWKFNETKVKEITKVIKERIDEHNRDKDSKFTILKACKVKLNVVVFGYSLPLFEKLAKQYRDKYSMKAKLNKHRDIVWGHFCDIVQKKSSDIIARNRFCEIIREHAENYVRQQLSNMIFTEIVGEFSVSKHELIIRILEDLAKSDELDLYKQYINDPYNYSFRWMVSFINKRCFEKPLLKYYELVEVKTRNIFAKISERTTCEGKIDLKYWLSQFQHKMKDELPIQPDAFYLVREEKVSDIDDFQNKVIQGLDKVRLRIEESFKRDTADSITWQNRTPYDKVMEKLWGCKSICPFCKEPCKWNSIHEGTPHSCIQHRTTGLAGWHYIESKILNLESCSFKVQSNGTFKCGRGTLCKRESDKCTVSGKTEDKHPYKEYKTYAPDWDIHPCPDISSSKYWAWVMCKYNKYLAQSYDLQMAEIPNSWHSYSKEDAIKSLRE